MKIGSRFSIGFKSKPDDAEKGVKQYGPLRIKPKAGQAGPEASRVSTDTNMGPRSGSDPTQLAKRRKTGEPSLASEATKPTLKRGSELRGKISAPSPATLTGTAQGRTGTDALREKRTELEGQQAALQQQLNALLDQPGSSSDPSNGSVLLQRKLASIQTQLAQFDKLAPKAESSVLEEPDPAETALARDAAGAPQGTAAQEIGKKTKISGPQGIYKLAPGELPPIDTSRSGIGGNAGKINALDGAPLLPPDAKPLLRRQALHSFVEGNAQQMRIYQKYRDRIKSLLEGTEGHEYETLQRYAEGSGPIRAGGAGKGLFDVYKAAGEFREPLQGALLRSFENGVKLLSKNEKTIGSVVHKDAFAQGKIWTPDEISTMLGALDESANSVFKAERAARAEVCKLIDSGATRQERRQDLASFTKKYTDHIKSFQTTANKQEVRAKLMEAVRDPSLLGRNRVNSTSDQSGALGSALSALQMSEWMQTFTLKDEPGPRLRQAIDELAKWAEDSAADLDSLKDRYGFKSQVRTEADVKRLMSMAERGADCAYALQRAIEKEAGVDVTVKPSTGHRLSSFGKKVASSVNEAIASLPRPSVMSDAEYAHITRLFDAAPDAETRAAVVAWATGRQPPKRTARAPTRRPEATPSESSASEFQPEPQRPVLQPKRPVVAPELPAPKLGGKIVENPESLLREGSPSGTDFPEGFLDELKATFPGMTDKVEAYERGRDSGWKPTPPKATAPETFRWSLDSELSDPPPEREPEVPVQALSPPPRSLKRKGAMKAGVEVGSTPVANEGMAQGREGRVARDARLSATGAGPYRRPESRMGSREDDSPPPSPASVHSTDLHHRLDPEGLFGHRAASPEVGAGSEQAHSDAEGVEDEVLSSSASDASSFVSSEEEVAFFKADVLEVKGRGAAVRRPTDPLALGELSRRSTQSQPSREESTPSPSTPTTTRSGMPQLEEFGGGALAESSRPSSPPMTAEPERPASRGGQVRDPEAARLARMAEMARNMGVDQRLVSGTASSSRTVPTAPVESFASQPLRRIPTGGTQLDDMIPEEDETDAEESGDEMRLSGHEAAPQTTRLTELDRREAARRQATSSTQSSGSGPSSLAPATTAPTTVDSVWPPLQGRATGLARSGTEQSIAEEGDDKWDAVSEEIPFSEGASSFVRPEDRDPKA